MKKRFLISGIILIASALILFLPIPQGSYDDGGTSVYSALTYKIVNWNRLMTVYNDNGVIERIDTYSATSVYWIPHNFKTIDELWEMEYPTNPTITMTIAETLPSCVDFEYREIETPYCFYAYDSDGALYRVLWTDFEGLDENDLIVVEYSDIKEFDYPNPPGGWTPKYEITATKVKVKRR